MTERFEEIKVRYDLRLTEDKQLLVFKDMAYLINEIEKYKKREAARKKRKK